MTTSDLKQTYNTMWSKAISAYKQIEFGIDEHLMNKASDMRRSITLIYRLRGEVSQKAGEMIASLRKSYPQQYFYHPDELHITVLSMFTATTGFLEKYQNLTWYQHAIQTVLEDAESFTVDFRGITASPNALMMQGFPQADALNLLRDSLRASLKKHGVGGDLDQRYEISTAHATFMRFQSKPADGEQFIRDISAFREQEFGRSHVGKLELVKNDWYLSKEKTRLVRKYRLQENRK
jgi:2'-5' RNA ligase